MKIKKIITYLSVLFLVIAMGYAFIMMKKVFTPNTNFETDKVYVYIPTNGTTQQAFDSIKKYVKDWDTFQKIFTQFDMDKKIIPGRFELKKGMNNYEIAQALRKNIPVQLTFNNQERIEDLVKIFAEQLEPNEADFYKTFTDSAFLKENKVNKESAIALYMPNTYEFYWNISPIKVRNKIHKQYIKFWNKERQQKAEKLKLSQAQVSTLASIVQKESSKVDERRKIAGVYLNRLKINEKLGADPTVIYAKKLQLNNFDTIIKRVYYKYLDIDSPYNTYFYKGLPPGPIAMPDEVSIDAVLNPEESDYLYFCASVEKMGYHKFAKTLEEHEKNRRKYIEWLNQKKIK